MENQPEAIQIASKAIQLQQQALNEIPDDLYKGS